MTETEKLYKICILDLLIAIDEDVVVQLSYEDRVSQQVPIHIDTNVDLSKNSNRKRLLNRLLKQSPNITEVTLVS